MREGHYYQVKLGWDVSERFGSRWIQTFNVAVLCDSTEEAVKLAMEAWSREWPSAALSEVLLLDARQERLILPDGVSNESN